MKIRTNYDLIEEATLANKGFSIKRYAKTVLKATAIGVTIILPLQTIDGITISETVQTVGKSLEVYAGLYGMYSVFSKGLEQASAIDNLSCLSTRLNNIYIDTNAHMLMEAKPYKTKYKLNFSSFPPQLEEKKYITIPVFSNWDNNERSIVQEHVIRSRIYDLSYGEPEEKKVYTYAMKKAIK